MSIITSHNDPPTAKQPGADDPVRYGILFKLEIPILLVHGPGRDFVSDLLANSIARALRDKGILCQDEPSVQNGFSAKDCAHVIFRFSPAIDLFVVSDLSAGLDTIRDALASVHALEFSEIGYLDYETRSWRGWYPRNSTEPFSKNLDLFAEWEAKEKAKKP